jgi:Holliday junction resolvase-like predicted endonuclease
MSLNNKNGKLGEDLAARHLIAAGYTILSRNMRYASFEVDIVVKLGESIEIVEVKCVTREMLASDNVAREMYALLEKIDTNKRIHLARAYGVISKQYSGMPVSFSVCTVCVSFSDKSSYIMHHKNVIL